MIREMVYHWINWLQIEKFAVPEHLIFEKETYYV